MQLFNGIFRDRIRLRRKIKGILVCLLVFSASHNAYAFFGELSAMGSYSRTNYAGHSYSTTKRYTGEAAVYITSVTQLEVSYAYTDTFFNYDPVQTTSINEQVLSLSVVQNLVPSSWVVQPFVKAGGAQYNRKQSGTVNGVPSNTSYTKSPSAVLGAGLRVYLLRNFSLKGEVVTYLPDMHISEAKSNYNAQFGISFRF